MSVESLAVVLHHSRMGGTAKVVMIGVANHDGDGGAWPSIATLAKYARVSGRRVQQAVHECVEAGELLVTTNAGGNGSTDPRYRPNLYAILVSCPEDCDGSTNHRSRGEGCDTPPGLGVKDLTLRGEGFDTPGVKDSSPEPSLNHPVTKRGASRRRPYTEVPETWTLTDEQVAWAGTNTPHLDIYGSTQEWLTACKAKDLRYADWNAAWKNAMRRALRWHKPEAARTYL